MIVYKLKNVRESERKRLDIRKNNVHEIKSATSSTD
jgi:hypothetical protein